MRVADFVGSMLDTVLYGGGRHRSDEDAAHHTVLKGRHTLNTEVPVNARTASEAVRFVRQELAKAGRTLTTASVLRTEPVRPFGRVAIDGVGAKLCFVLHIEFTNTEVTK